MFLRIGQTVRLESGSDGSITIRPVLERPNLEALLAQVTPENLPDDADVSWRIGFSNAIGQPKNGPEKAPGRARRGPQ